MNFEARHRWVAIVLAAATVSGCMSGPEAVSNSMRSYFLPGLGRNAEFEAIPDWRTLDRPTDGVRAYFAAEHATYRVISATPDSAELAVWRTDEPGPEPFNGNQVATGTGCVSLNRGPEPGSITTNQVGCRTPLAVVQPSWDDTSWGRDSEAHRHAAVVIEGLVDQPVRWLMTREEFGAPRSTPRTLDQIVAAVGSAQLSPGEKVVLDDVRQQGGQVTGRITGYASDVDVVDTDRTINARVCFDMRIDLADTHPNFLFFEVDCR